MSPTLCPPQPGSPLTVYSGRPVGLLPPYGAWVRLPVADHTVPTGLLKEQTGREYQIGVGSYRDRSLRYRDSTEGTRFFVDRGPPDEEGKGVGEWEDRGPVGGRGYTGAGPAFGTTLGSLGTKSSTSATV